MKPLAQIPPNVTGFRIALPRALRCESTGPEASLRLSCVSLSLQHADKAEHTHHHLTILETQKLRQALTDAESSALKSDNAVPPAELLLHLEEGEVVYRLPARHGRSLIDALDKALARLHDAPPLILSHIHMGYVIGWATEGAAAALHVKIDGEADTTGAPRRILFDVHHVEDRTTTVWLDDEEVEHLDRVLEGALVAVAAGISGPAGELPAQGAPPWLTISTQDRRAVELRFEEDPEAGEAFRGGTIHLAEGSAKELRRLLREAMLAKGALPDAPVAPEGEILIEELSWA